MARSYIKIDTSRDAYSAKELLNRTMTVGELIEELQNWDEDTPILLSFDNDYTYGRLTANSLIDEWSESE